MRIVQRSNGYWIVDNPLDTPDIGPYAKLKGNDPDNCAMAAMRGLESFWVYEWSTMPTSKPKVKIKRLTSG